MKPALFLWLKFSLCAPFMMWGLLAQVTTSGPTLKVLYTFRTAGTPTNIVEVQPGRFFGVVQTSQGIFSITSSGNYQYIYGFPTMSSGLAVFGLTPALNGQAYGSATNLGPVGTFSELFSVALNDKVTP